MKFFKNSNLLILSLLVFFVFTFFFVVPASVSAFSLNPFSFLEKTGNIIVSRVSDIIYYLVMQKRYIFDDFQDPNVYGTLEIPAKVENIISATNTTDIKINISPIAPKDFSLPKVAKTSAPSQTQVKSQVIPDSPVVTKLIDIKGEKIPDKSDGSLILLYTNKERATESLKSLVANDALDYIASERVDDLFSNQYFEHNSPDGKTVSNLAENGVYDYLIIGENLALGTFDGDKGIVTAWMESPGHRANILNKQFIELGVAVKEGIFNGEKATIAVQVFALPLSNCPRPSQDTKLLIDDTATAIKKMQIEALAMYDNLTTIKNYPDIDRSYYNQKIKEYNYFALKVNEAVSALKIITDSYNVDVNRYNSCIHP